MFERQRKHTNTRWCLMRIWIIAGLLVGGGVVSCDRQEEAVASAETKENSRRAPTRRRIYFGDMIDSYKSGEVEKAREEARKHLERRERQWRTAKRDFTRYSGISSVFAVLKNMLHYENQLAPDMRLGDDPDFVGWIQDVLLETWAAAGTIENAPSGKQRQIKWSQGIVAREWLRARAHRLPREELEELYLVFQADLEAQGLLSVDSVLAYQPPEPPSQPKVRHIDRVVAAKITNTLGNYLTGLVTSDLALVQSATGCSPEECQAYIENTMEDIAEENLLAIKAVIVPELTREQLSLTPLPSTEKTYRITFRDVTYKAVLPNGDETERRIDKAWTVHEDGNGKWLVLPFA